MDPKFNINRPKVSDEEIKKHQDFETLVKQFKEQSLKKARGDESWWSHKYIRYAATIAGITVICTITYNSLKNKKQNQQANETLTTQKKQNTEPLNSKTTAFISEPSKKHKVNYSAYTVNNGKGGNIAHSTGTKIKVPKNSFVDKNGKEIVGDVTIEYREFHDAGDIILSGIPMKYDSAGKAYNFESAGMFDIRGYKDGEAVYIKSGNKLGVELASTNGKHGFNQYYLDTIARNWQYLKRDEAMAIPIAATHAPVAAQKAPENAKTATLKKEIEVVIPKKVDSLKQVYLAQIQKLPKVAEPNKPAQARPGRPTFEIQSDVGDFPELAGFENMQFEVGEENKNYNPEMTEVTWSNVKITEGPQPGKNYLITLTYLKRVERLVVYPVIPAEDYKKAQTVYHQKLKEYQQRVEKRDAEERKLLAEMEARQATWLNNQLKKQEELKKEQENLRARYDASAYQELKTNFGSLGAQAKAMRLFEVARFGIYNSDHPVSEYTQNPIVPSFVTNDNKILFAVNSVYLVDHSNKTTYSLRASDNFSFASPAGSEISLCVFSGEQIFVCTKQNFKLAIVSGQKPNFKLVALGDDKDNIVDFKKALEI